jgi:hypothetical protein
VPIWVSSRTSQSFFGFFLFYFILDLITSLGEQLLLHHQLRLLLLPFEFYLLYFFFFVFVLELQLLNELILFFFLGIRLAAFLLFFVFTFASSTTTARLIVITSKQFMVLGRIREQGLSLGLLKLLYCSVHVVYFLFLLLDCFSRLL